MKKKWWRSLQVKIVAWSFVPTAIILSAVAWFTFYSYQKVIGDLAIKQESDVVHTKLEQVTGALGRLIDPVLIPFFRDIFYYNKEPLPARAQYIFDRASDLQMFDGGIHVLDPQGKVSFSLPERSELLGADWSSTPTFRYVTEHTNTYALTDLQSAGSNSSEVICAAAAMTGLQGEFVGASYYCFRIGPAIQNAYYQTLSDLNLGSGIFVLDGNQRVLFSTSQSEIGKDLSDEAYIQELLTGQISSRRFRNGSVDMVVSYVRTAPPVRGQVRWLMLKEQSWSDIMRPTLAYRQLLLVMLALGVIVPVLVTAYGVRHITEPIQRLIQAAAQVTAGQFKHRIEAKTGDEIEILADQFNLMSKELDDSYSLLEKKVAERTHALATLNAIAAHVSNSLNLNEIMADGLERVMELTGMERGMAYRIAGGGGDDAANTTTEVEEAHLRVMAYRGIPATMADFGDRLPLRQSAAGEAGRRGEPVIWTLAELPTASASKERLAALGIEQVIAIPLMTKGRLVGSLNLSTNQSKTYPPEQIALLKTIGQQIGVAVENAYLYEQAEQSAIAAERHRLARELHDAVTQTLFSANLIADVIPRVWKRSPDEGLQNLEELRQLTRGALAEMRTLLLEMRPESLERAGLTSLLTQLADAIVGRVRVPVHLEVHDGGELPQDVKIVFYRVAQEALNNIAKHSGAQHVALHLDAQPGHLHLCIQDDGLGFDLGAIPTDHLGMAIMRERASAIGAWLQIESQPGHGTTVELDWRSAGKEGPDGHLADDSGNAGG
jgi:nitrate/nitrite-specific signal transduction histidine kinase